MREGGSEAPQCSVSKPKKQVVIDVSSPRWVHGASLRGRAASPPPAVAQGSGEWRSSEDEPRPAPTHPVQLPGRAARLCATPSAGPFEGGSRGSKK